MIGFIIWIGGLLSCLNLLVAQRATGEKCRVELVAVARRAAMLMDMGALFAIAAGFYIAFAQTPNAFKTGGWLHVKLTLVVLGLLAIHGYTRVKLKKLRRGEAAPLPSFIYPLTLILIAAIVIVATIKPFS